MRGRGVDEGCGRGVWTRVWEGIKAPEPALLLVLGGRGEVQRGPHAAPCTAHPHPLTCSERFTSAMRRDRARSMVCTAAKMLGRARLLGGGCSGERVKHQTLLLVGSREGG